MPAWFCEYKCSANRHILILFRTYCKSALASGRGYFGSIPPTFKPKLIYLLPKPVYLGDKLIHVLGKLVYVEPKSVYVLGELVYKKGKLV
jgi:hypothetical protein